jgi:hypothetical protein
MNSRKAEDLAISELLHQSPPTSPSQGQHQEQTLLSSIPKSLRDTQTTTPQSPLDNTQQEPLKDFSACLGDQISGDMGIFKV